MLFEKIKIYLSEVKKMNREHPDNFQVLELIELFPSWLQSVSNGKNALTTMIPWIPFAAIKFLNKILIKDMRVFEYGAGGSSLYFAKRVKEVMSIEHDKSWSQKMLEVIQEHGFKNLQLRLIEPKEDPEAAYGDPSDIDSYVSLDEIYKGRSFKDYARSIDEYPDGYFDVVMIDGRARPSCFKHLVTKVKKNGFLILDNADRDYYFNIHKNLDTSHWKKYVFHRPGPYNSYFWQTCIWQKV